jgi:hypothetical protein
LHNDHDYIDMIVKFTIFWPCSQLLRYSDNPIVASFTCRDSHNGLLLSQPVDGPMEKVDLGRRNLAIYRNLIERGVGQSWLHFVTDLHCNLTGVATWTPQFTTSTILWPD